MSSIAAISLLAVRSAIRSRLWIALTMMVLAVALGLPVTLKGDGTIHGLSRITITYTMWMSSFLISLAAVWAGCGAISLDVRDRQMHLILTKPVRASEVWVGKWVALAGLTTVLCMAAAGGGAIALRTAVRGGEWTAEDLRVLQEEILVARQPLAPIISDLDRRTAERIREEVAAGRWPPEGESVATARRRIRTALQASEFTVHPGSRTGWEIELPPRMYPSHPAHLRFRFATSTMEAAPVKGRWWLFGESGRECWSVDGEWMPGTLHSLTLSGLTLMGEQRVRLVFENRDRLGGTLLFDPDDGIRLLVWQGSAAGNFARAWVMMWCHILVLAAVGLTAGSLLSMPVASFVAVTAVLVARMGGYVANMAGQPVFVDDLAQAPAWAVMAERIWQMYFAAMNWLLRPLGTVGVFDRLASGELVSWGEMWRMATGSLLIGCGLLGGLGVVLLRVRELGATQE